MKLSETLYTLRKKSGLSQEQLAEALGVSRQAVSKWERGVAVPEGETLIAISRYFSVSLDSLIAEGGATAAEPRTVSPKENPRLFAGLVLCILGFVTLIAWGAVMVLRPSLAEHVAAMSVVTLDGQGILLIVCCLLIALGVILLLRTGGNKK